MLPLSSSQNQLQVLLVFGFISVLLFFVCFKTLKLTLYSLTCPAIYNPTLKLSYNINAFFLPSLSILQNTRVLLKPKFLCPNFPDKVYIGTFFIDSQDCFYRILRNICERHVLICSCVMITSN